MAQCLGAKTLKDLQLIVDKLKLIGTMRSPGPASTNIDGGIEEHRNKGLCTGCRLKVIDRV